MANSKFNVLIVDDEKTVIDNLKILLSDLTNCKLYFALNAEDSKKILNSVDIDLLISDINLPETSGFELLNFVKEKFPKIPVVIITAYSSWQTARDALKNGAFDYIAKPIKSTDLKLIIEKAINHRISLLESKKLKEKNADTNFLDSIIGSAPKIIEIKELIKKIAPTDSTALITGESGTGKELVAHAIHNLSNRSAEKFITVNCGAIPHTLLESELFGFMKGAFTGAVSSKPGYFELANNGTLFLDEIAELPLDLQVKILRVVEGYPFMRLGGEQEISANVRLIAATNKNLEELVSQNLFRLDLFYRLAIFQIKMPTLAERREDIEELSIFFINEFNKKHNKKIKGLSNEVLQLFQRHEWRGNIRELRNVIEHSVLIENSEIITLKSLPNYLNAVKLKLSNVNQTAKTNDQFENAEIQLIQDALQKTNYNKNQAAKLLGISRQALQYKINKYKNYLGNE